MSVVKPALVDTSSIFTTHSYQDDQFVTQQPNAIRRVYSAKVSDKYKCMYCFHPTCLCSYLQWDKIKSRMYTEVHENRIETNRPYSCCCLCIKDNVDVYYFKKNKKFQKVNCCSAYLCCGCIPCCGEVAGINRRGCPSFAFCCRSDIAGLKDANDFATAARQARREYFQRKEQGSVVTQQPGAM